MIRFVLSLIVIVLSVFAFVGLVMPSYEATKETRAEEVRLEKIVENANQLAAARQELEQKFASISQADKDRLERMVPKDIENVQLILEFQELAALYGITLQNVSVSDNTEDQEEDFFNTVDPYQEVELQFTLLGNYPAFVRFVENIEQSLRLIDISDISFTATSPSEEDTQVDDVYSYNVIVSTYWMK